MKNSKIAGLKLLILGGSVNEVPLVQRAKELGVYTIVADYFTDRLISPAKNLADEVWDENWMDVDRMAQLCLEAGVEGITAGYSEVKIDYLIQLCQKLNLPCYSTAEQLEITRDKVKFKEECRRCSVPTVREYNCPDEVDEYPVIVKPVDRGGSIGISIASNRQELDTAYAYAMEMSYKNQVIIEKYMTCRKVDIYYAVEDGVVTPITTCDVVMSEKNGLERVVQNAWLYPHNKEKNLLEKEDRHLRSMIQDMGIRYGCIFFSGFIDKTDNYTFFECGFRTEGGHQHEYVRRRGYYNYLDLFIHHALLGTTKYMDRAPELHPALKLLTVNYYAKSGIIAKINGFDTVRKLPECTLSLLTSHIGEKCDEERAILAKIGMISIADEDAAALQEKVLWATQQIDVRDKDGHSMIYDVFNPTAADVAHWWD